MSNIKQKLHALREAMEADAGATITAMGEQPVALVLADVCGALGLEGQAAAEVLGAEGARQVECTINGIGERAGNCALEEIVMAVRTRRDYFGVSTGINTRKLYQTSRLVSHVTGLVVQRNKAIVGQNAFSHEAGIHQDGMLKDSSTYQIMDPGELGLAMTLPLGKHSGRHAFRRACEEAGIRMTDAELGAAFQRFKVLADSRKAVSLNDVFQEVAA